MVDFKPFVHIFVEVFQELLTGFLHAGFNHGIKSFLQPFESLVNLFMGSAVLIYFQNFALKIHSGFQGAEHIIRGTKHSCEQVKFVA